MVRRILRHGFNKKVDIVFRVAEFDFRFVCYVKMLTHLSHNVGKTVISELAVKIKHLCCMIMRSECLNKPCV